MKTCEITLNQNSVEHPEAPADDQALHEVKLSRKKRGVAPVLGMDCPPGYKLVGDECVFANPGFD
jgi:hypothetical protein